MNVGGILLRSRTGRQAPWWLGSRRLQRGCPPRRWIRLGAEACSLSLAWFQTSLCKHGAFTASGPLSPERANSKSKHASGKPHAHRHGCHSAATAPRPTGGH